MNTENPDLVQVRAYEETTAAAAAAAAAAGALFKVQSPHVFSLPNLTVYF